MFKAVLAIVLFPLLLAVVLVVAGVSGLTFKLWPTFWPDAELSITASQIDKLKKLRAAPKFLIDEKLFYFGAPNEEIRKALEFGLNETLDVLMERIQLNPKKSEVLSIYKQVLPHLENLDTDEKDRMLRYLNEVMQILEIESSNELLNVWRYGFPYGWFMK